MQLYECDGNASQVWRRVGNALMNTNSGRCLDDPAFSTVNGTQLEIYDCNGGTNQQWFDQTLQQNNPNPTCGGNQGSWATGARINEGQILGPGMQLQSPNGNCKLVVQATDGNTVLYGPGGTVWPAPNTIDHPGDCLIMQQSDGNLVAYDSSGHAIWANGTRAPGVQFRDLLTVFLNGEGSIDSVINGTGPASVWATKSIPSNVISYP